MTPRRLWVLVKTLPSDSPLHAALRADEQKSAAKAKAAAVDEAEEMIRRASRA